MEKGVLRNFTKFTGKHLCQNLRPATLSNKRLWHRCFSVKFAKFLRTAFLQNTSWRLLLNLSLRCWFSEEAAHRRFSKWVFLKTLWYWSLFLIINLLVQNTYGGCFWIFVAANTFLQLNMVFIADNRTGSKAATRGVLLKKGVLRSFAKLTGKPDSHLPKKFLFICSNENPLKTL